MTPMPGFMYRKPILRPDMPRSEYETNPAYYALLYRNSTPGENPTTGRPLWYFVTINNGPDAATYRGEYIMDTRQFETIEEAEGYVATLLAII